MQEDIKKLFTDLKLRGMDKIFEQLLKGAEHKDISHQQFVYSLLKEEFSHRRERSMVYRVKQAKIPWDWTLRTFPFKKQPVVKRTQIMTLAGLDFINRGENIVFIGKTGTGKSGLASGILREAVVSGYRGRFYNTQDLLDELYASLADRSTPRLLRRLCNYDLLVLDELGYLNLTKEQMNGFFKLMKERYEANRPTIITTNLNFEEWYDFLKPKDMVEALLDRLNHRCIIIDLTDGKSLRTRK